jgi:hypothetical protein
MGMTSLGTMVQSIEPFNAGFPFVLSVSKQERKPGGFGPFIPFDFAQDKLRRAQDERPESER